TLLLGLTIIVIFAGLAGLSGSVSGIVAFRAGWGLGNALFIATSLAAIVSSARGGFAGAIILYEAALGLGIAAGPLLGGTLGTISWRGPFFGVSALMLIALIATIVLLPHSPKPDRHTSISAPLRALRHRGLLTISLAALCYNWGFFTMLGYAPFPMNISAINLGWVFFGWGLLVAFSPLLPLPGCRHDGEPHVPYMRPLACSPSIWRSWRYGPTCWPYSLRRSSPPASLSASTTR